MQSPNQRAAPLERGIGLARVADLAVLELRSALELEEAERRPHELAQRRRHRRSQPASLQAGWLAGWLAGWPGYGYGCADNYGGTPEKNGGRRQKPGYIAVRGEGAR